MFGPIQKGSGQFVTMAETLVQRYTPETKQQSKQCVEEESKVNRICQEGHGQCVLWYQRDPVSFEKGRTITGKYYSNLLDQLDIRICEKRPGLKKGKNHSSPGKCTCSLKCVSNGETAGFEVEFTQPSPLFSRLCTLRLSFLPKPEEICFWKALHVQWRSWEIM